jgi:hypothetical protein
MGAVQIVQIVGFHVLLAVLIEGAWRARRGAPGQQS